MNPILLGRQVEQGLKDLVRSTLNLTSPAFDGMVERFLTEPKNFVQGPWVSLSMPFRQALEDTEPFPQVPLGFRAHRHQELAFNRLGCDQPQSTMIATGTGSGKTESFLWPILDYCRQHKAEPGIKAILIYPMNALATDQAKRIAKAIHSNSSLQGVRCGLYADAEPKLPTDSMTEDEVITRRQAMRDNPPDILLTNYKMLDYLLLRGGDRQLWAKNLPETLRFLVVDEMHSFDGAQGADLALLIRRLKSRLESPKDHIACVGSSATLGSSDSAAKKLLAYAENIFGESFDSNAVIREDRLPVADILQPPEYLELPDPLAIGSALAVAQTLDQPHAASHLARCFFPELNPDSALYDASLPADPESQEWRIMLGGMLMQHVAAQRVITLIAESGGAVSIDSVVQGFAGSRLFSQWQKNDLAQLVEAVVSLIAWARMGDVARPQPLFNVRIQYWAREMARMVASLPATNEFDARTDIDLAHSDDLEPSELRRHLPIIHCMRCGTGGHLGRQDTKDSTLWSATDQLYEEFFGTSQRLRIIFHEPVSRIQGENRTGKLVSGFLDSSSLRFTQGDHSGPSEAGGQSPVWLFDPLDQNGRVDRTCPACGTAQSLQIFGMRAARLTAALASTLYNSEQNEQKANEKPRLLLFSDSVQDAAQRAAVSEIRNTGNVIRKSLYQATEEAGDVDLTLKKLIDDQPLKIHNELGPEAFVARYIARDQVWRDDYKLLCSSGRLEDADRFVDHVRQRLGWEYFSDLTYRSHTAQTLEASRLVTADVDPTLIATVAAKFPEALEAHISPELKIEQQAALYFLTGLLQYMRRRGAVAHPYLVRALEHGDHKGPNYFAAGRALGLGRTGALPIPNHRRAAAPMPPTLRSNLEGYESVLADRATNWYRDWADRFFLTVYPLAAASYGDIYAKVFELLETAKIVRKVAQGDNGHKYGFVINPAVVRVSNRLNYLECGQCHKKEAFLSASQSEGSPCTRIGCTGHLRTEPEATPNIHMQGLMTTRRNHRVVAREHTGILDSDDRRELERQFISSNEAWSPNLISATPTLEMGIDIGDLSTLLLCSVPPEVANYVQRIGRTGRRDGNSLNLTFINARPHDLQFWESPENMLRGEVTAPGVHLEAIAVLRRQVAAFTLDRLVASSEQAGDYKKVRDVLTTLETNKSQFPLDWFAYIESNSADLARDFIALLPDHIAARAHLTEQINRYLKSRGDESLIWKVQSAFADIRREKEELQRLLKELDALQAKLRKQSPPPTDLEKKINGIKDDKAEIRHSIRNGIDEVRTLNFLTDRGLLPNYAFPEEGIKLKSILASQREKISASDGGSSLKTIEYIRPATAALSEFAPWQTFYADGREVNIDRLDLTARDISEWRFCQKCSYVEKEVTAKAHSSCPKCQSDMWSDTGSVQEAIELKTVIAVTSESKAAIKDSDDRKKQQYDRAMFPAYSPADVEEAWASTGRENSVPFGYEYISACEFRDFNFGEKASAPIGPVIAGEPRKSYPFRVCRECGRLQKPPRRDDDMGEHQPRCAAANENRPRVDWEAMIFLLRQFTTEAIRLIIPVVGEADHNDIKSFIAAIELGMRKHFDGKVDHIRSTVVEGQIGTHNLYLYDSVPGGSGYLRQLAEHPDTLKNVVEQAIALLRDCRCASEERDGCFRCVKSYRSQFGPGTPSRNTALAMMETVLQHWDNLKKVDSELDSAIRDDLVDSILERRFLEALRREFGPGNLKPRLLEGARQGFQLNTGTEGNPAFWTIETQVQIDQRFPGLPRKRIDFLVSPTSGQKCLPIVIEMDGLTYHASTAAEDLETRLLIIRSRKVAVWSFAWDDVSEAENQIIANPFSESRLGAGVSGMLANLLNNQEFAYLKELAGTFELLQSASSIKAFAAFLKSSKSNCAEAAIVLARLALGRDGQPIDSLPRISQLSSDSRLFLEEKPIHGLLEDQNLDLYVSAPDILMDEAFRETLDYRMVLRASLPDLAPDAGLTLGLPAAWRAIWRTVNLLQALPGFHVEFEGMDGLAAPIVSADLPSKDDAAWIEVEALAEEGFSAIVEALKAAGVPPPDLIGHDVMDGDMVSGMIELGWSAAKLGLSEVGFSLNDWNVILVDPETDFSMTELMNSILTGLERTT